MATRSAVDARSTGGRASRYHAERFLSAHLIRDRRRKIAAARHRRPAPIGREAYIIELRGDEKRLAVIHDHAATRRRRGERVVKMRIVCSGIVAVGLKPMVGVLEMVDVYVMHVERRVSDWRGGIARADRVSCVTHDAVAALEQGHRRDDRMPLLDAALEGTNEEAARARVTACGASVDGRALGGVLQLVLTAAASENAAL